MRLLLAFVFLGLFSCLEGSQPRDLDNRPIKEYCKQVKKDRGWIVVGGGRAWHKGVRQLTLLLKGSQYLTISEARKVFVDESQKLIDRLNKNKNNRSYLQGAPFTFQNLALSISFQDKSEKFICDPYVACVALAGGRLIYDRCVPQSGLLSTIYEEPYLEALRIVQEGG